MTQPAFVKTGEQTKSQGYVILFAVVLLSVISASIAVSLVVLGLAHSRTNAALVESISANAAATACAEIALDDLRLDQAYVGGQTINLSSADCAILPVQFADPVYTIGAQATVGSSVSRISVQAEFLPSPPSMQIDSWQEVPSF